jgi:hypothetical protein
MMTHEPGRPTPSFFVGPLTTRDGTVCTNTKPPQSCFWVTIICFDKPQTRSTFNRSTVIPTRRVVRRPDRLRVLPCDRKQMGSQQLCL